MQVAIGPYSLHRKSLSLCAKSPPGHLRRHQYGGLEGIRGGLAGARQVIAVCKGGSRTDPTKDFHGKFCDYKNSFSNATLYQRFWIYERYLRDTILADLLSETPGYHGIHPGSIMPGGVIIFEGQGRDVLPNRPNHGIPVGKGETLPPAEFLQPAILRRHLR